MHIRVLPIAVLTVASAFFTPYSAQAVLYAPGETLQPSCAPTDSNCGVTTNVSPGTIGQVAYYAASGSIVTPSSAFTILSNGNVGIGITNPTSTLSILGTLNIATSSVSAFNIQDGSLSNVFTVNTAPGALGDIFDIESSTGALLFGIAQSGQQVSSTTVPTISSCGTATFYGDDSAMSITTGTTGTCTATFGTSYVRKPTCNVTNRSASLTNAMSYTVSATAVTVTQTALNGAVLDIICKSTGNGG